MGLSEEARQTIQEIRDTAEQLKEATKELKQKTKALRAIRNRVDNEIIKPLSESNKEARTRWITVVNREDLK